MLYSIKLHDKCTSGIIRRTLTHTHTHAPSLPQLCCNTPHQSSLLLSSKSGSVVWIYSLHWDVYLPLPFLNERLTITLSLTSANYCHLNEGFIVCVCVCVCVSECLSRAPVCDLMFHRAFGTKYTFTFFTILWKVREPQSSDGERGGKMSGWEGDKTDMKWGGEKKKEEKSVAEKESIKKMMSNEESGGRNLLQYVSCLHHFFPYLQLSLSLLFLPFHANGEKKACTAVWRKRSTSFCALNGALMLWSTYKRTLRKISIFLLFTVNNLSRK